MAFVLRFGYVLLICTLTFPGRTTQDVPAADRDLPQQDVQVPGGSVHFDKLTVHDGGAGKLTLHGRLVNATGTSLHDLWFVFAVSDKDGPIRLHGEPFVARTDLAPDAISEFEASINLDASRPKIDLVSLSLKITYSGISDPFETSTPVRASPKKQPKTPKPQPSTQPDIVQGCVAVRNITFHSSWWYGPYMTASISNGCGREVYVSVFSEFFAQGGSVGMDSARLLVPAGSWPEFHSGLQSRPVKTDTGRITRVFVEAGQ